MNFNLVVAKIDRQTAQFNSPPNFPAIWYIICIKDHGYARGVKEFGQGVNIDDEQEGSQDRSLHDTRNNQERGRRMTI